MRDIRKIADNAELKYIGGTMSREWHREVGNEIKYKIVSWFKGKKDHKPNQYVPQPRTIETLETRPKIVRKDGNGIDKSTAFRQLDVMLDNGWKIVRIEETGPDPEPWVPMQILITLRPTEESQRLQAEALRGKS